MKIKSDVALSALFAGAVPLAVVWFAFGAWIFGGDIRCETDKPEHYLDFYDEANSIYREAIEIFPSEIPEYAEDVKYYYNLDGDYYEVFAEWSIPGYTTSEEDMKALLEERIPLPVVLWDERRTTIDAHQILFNSGKNAKKRKKVVDAVAASLILEGYLTYKKSH